MTPLLTDLSCDAFGQVARGATVSGWTNLLRTSRGMRARVERWRSQAGRPWPWSPTALYLCAGRELSYEEADEVDDATVRTCLSLAGSPVHLVLHGLRSVTPQGPDGPLVRNLHVSACAVLTEWLRLPGRMDAMPLLNDFAPHAHVHAVLGACARCLCSLLSPRTCKRSRSARSARRSCAEGVARPLSRSQARASAAAAPWSASRARSVRLAMDGLRAPMASSCTNAASAACEVRVFHFRDIVTRVARLGFEL